MLNAKYLKWTKPRLNTFRPCQVHIDGCYWKFWITEALEQHDRVMFQTELRFHDVNQAKNELASKVRSLNSAQIEHNARVLVVFYSGIRILRVYIV